MSIRIERVEVNSCGPISTFNEEMCPLTIVYSKNERGKTTIVENIIASLFKDQKDRMYPLLRKEFIGPSRISVRGISPKAEVFTPESKQKIDRLLEKEGSVLPKSLFNLLVVRGAESDIIQEKGGITRGALKSLISRQHLYEEIRKKIPREVGYTQFSDGLITAKKRTGGYKAYEENRSRLDALGEVSEEFYATLSETELISLQARKAEMEKKLTEQGKAKRHYAYSLSRKVQETQEELSRLKTVDLEELGSNVSNYFRDREEYGSRKGELEQHRQIDEDSRWIDGARERYEKCLNRTVNVPQRVSLVIATLFLAGAYVSYVLLPLLMAIFMGLGLLAFISTILFTFVFRRTTTPESAAIEINQIKEEFKKRFARALSSSADFNMVKSGLDRKFGEYQRIEIELKSTASNLEALRGKVLESLLLLGISDRKQDNWPFRVKELKDAQRQMDGLIIKYEERLGGLGVDESDYLKEAAAEEYSREKEERIKKQTAQLEERIEEEHGKSEEVRKRMVEHIGLDTAYSQRIEDAAETLEQKKREYREAMVDALAGMIAGHVVSDSLEQFRRHEDEQIESYLNDEQIAGLIEKFTRRYNRISLLGEEVRIGTEGQSFDLKAMSTGAQEQILLALRMGIARKLSGKDSLFLILDDAFQYSDWDRRPVLVEQAVEAVRSGWQVIYFSMDDNIRDLFKKAAKNLRSEDFKLIEL